MFRVLEIAARGSGLQVRDGLVAVLDSSGEERSFPLDEIGAVILANPAVSVTGEVLSLLSSRCIPVICCDRRYLPVGVYWPVSGRGVDFRERLEAQLHASCSLRKRLWQRVIRNKIESQAAVLRKYRGSCRLDGVARLVKSGDRDGVESRAAVIYWRTLNLFPRRDRGAADENMLLNYVYSILYASVARYLCAAGLELRIGIHHHNQYDAFCLASDLMEPYRAVADAVVLDHLGGGGAVDLGSETRRRLVAGLYGSEVGMGSGRVSLFSAVRETAGSLKRSFKKRDAGELLLPEFRGEG